MTWPFDAHLSTREASALLGLTEGQFLRAAKRCNIEPVGWDPYTWKRSQLQALEADERVRLLQVKGVMES